MRIYKIFFRSIAMVIMVMILSDCRQSYYIARNTGRNIMTLSDHQRAKSALNANDLNAAQGYLTGEKYNNRYRPVSGEESGEVYNIGRRKSSPTPRRTVKKCVMMRSISLISLCLKQKRECPNIPILCWVTCIKPWRYC